MVLNQEQLNTKKESDPNSLDGDDIGETGKLNMSKLKEDFERRKREAVAARYLALKQKKRNEMAEVFLWYTYPVGIICLLVIVIMWG